MKIVIWQGCVVEQELDFPGTDGPDLHVDPYNLPESISVRRQHPHGEVHEVANLEGYAR